MTQEKIIRDEAKEFFQNHIEANSQSEPIKQFHSIKDRLNDFYSAEYKSIFLDEIEICIEMFLTNHRIRYHKGQPKLDCQHEVNTEKLLFYIKQEIETLPIVAHQNFKTNSTQKREKVFVSYSHLDKDFLTDIKRHFKPFLQHIDFWDDSKIQPGQKWKDEINKAISETKVAILLVSIDFLGSEFITKNELPPLLKAAEENGAVILILILKPCYFEEFKELNQYQALNPPSRPMIKMDETEKGELLVNLVRQTLRILNNE